MDRTEYLALFMDADSESQKTEIIKAYLKALDPDAVFYLHHRVDGYRFTMTKSHECEGWDYELDITDTVVDALRFAKEKHKGQLRYDGLPYFKHVLEVVDILIEDGCGWENTLLAAALHDILENTETTYDELNERFGERAAKTVELLTKIEGESFDEYIDKIFFDEGLDMPLWPLRDESLEPCKKTNCHLKAKARDVILADRLANLRTLHYCENPGKIKEYIEETKRCILSRVIAPKLSWKIMAEVNKLGSIV